MTLFILGIFRLLGSEMLRLLQVSCPLEYLTTASQKVTPIYTEIQDT